MKHGFFICILSTVALASVVLMRASSKPLPTSPSNALAGLSGISIMRVTVQNIPSEIKSGNLSALRIQSGVESNLRAGGIQVDGLLSGFTMAIAQHTGRVEVTIDSIRYKREPRYACVIEVQLKRILDTGGVGNNLVEASVWSKRIVTFVDAGNTKAIYGDVGKLVNRLISDDIQANRNK